MTPLPLPPQTDRRSVAAGFAGFFNAFVDPKATARAVRAPFAWLWPLIVLGVASVLYGYLFFAPLMLTTMRNYPPEGLSGPDLERALHFAEMFAKVGVFIGPLFIAGILALLAALVMLMASMLSLRVKFRDVFALMSACSLISALQIVARYFVLHAKAGEIGSMQQLRPAFGLDIFFSDLKGPALRNPELFLIVSGLVSRHAGARSRVSDRLLQGESIYGDYARM